MIEWRRKKKNLSAGIFVRPLRKKALLRFFGVRGAPRPPLRGSKIFLWYIPNLGGGGPLLLARKTPKIFGQARYENPEEGLLK